MPGLIFQPSSTLLLNYFAYTVDNFHSCQLSKLSHSLFLPENPSDGYYTYGATYVGDIINETDANPILNGEISPSGIFSGVIVHKLSKNTVARCNASFSQGKWLASQLCLDHQTPNSALSLALDKFNPISMSGLMVAQFMRRISDSLSLGFDYQAMRRDQDNFLARCGLVGLVKYRDSQLLLSVANKMPYFSASLTQKYFLIFRVTNLQSWYFLRQKIIQTPTCFICSQF